MATAQQGHLGSVAIAVTSPDTTYTVQSVATITWWRAYSMAKLVDITPKGVSTRRWAQSSGLWGADLRGTYTGDYREWLNKVLVTVTLTQNPVNSFSGDGWITDLKASGDVDSVVLWSGSFISCTGLA